MARVKVINPNLNQDLIGGNFTNTASETVFTLGNFSVTSNFSGRRTRNYSNELSSFVKPITLETLGLDESESEIVFNFTNDVVLNLDRSDLRTFVKYGSTRELLRISIQQIINNYPASLFVNSQFNVGGNVTITDFSFNPLTDISEFNIPSTIINNTYGLVFDNGNTSRPENNELRNLNLSFSKYVIWRKDNSTGNTNVILGFTGDTPSSPIVRVQVKGNPFPELSASTTGSIDYHLKPQPVEFNKFIAELTQIESYFLLNRTTGQTAFDVEFKDPTQLESGQVIFTSRTLSWATTDGYNPDISGGLFTAFLNSILNIGEKYDTIKTDLIARFLVPDSLKVYDLTNEGKMTKLLRIYGAEFDQLRTFVDSLVFINRVTYDKKDNIPDVLVKNLARTLGWDVFTLVSENTLLESFFAIDGEESEDTLMPAEIDIELWRRILINTNYYWKSKGTRDAIRSIFLLIGIPDPFINITEYIYTVDGKIDPNTVDLSIEDLPSASFPFDDEGFPIAPVETNDFYFQISGNTDSGQAYINNYRNVGFTLNRTVDNKKSWPASGATERIDSTTPNYFQEDSRLLVNTKEVDVTLDLARGIEFDVFCYNKEVDDPITSTGFTKPFIYINVPFEYGFSANTFTIPDVPLSGSSIQVNFNGITLTSGGTGVGDYLRTGNQEVTLNTEVAQTYSNGDKDIVTLTYLHDKLGTTGFTKVQYLVQVPIISGAGTVLQLPEEPKGDVQLIINGITLTKGTSLFVGDFIIDPNDRSKIIVQNSSLQQYLLTNPIVRIWYIVDGDTPSSAEKRSEAHRVDSFSSSKFFFNAGINRFVYVLDFTAFDIEAIKMTLNGVTLQNGTDFTLNPTNKNQVYLLPGIKFGDIIGAYYMITDSSFVSPLLPSDPTFPPIQDMTFLEYLELIQRRLINVKNRKIITDNTSGYYPTVQRIYDEYIKRSFFSSSNLLKSNGYTFQNLYPFINQYNAFFNRFLNQLLPATIILKKAGIMIRNTSFTRQKFKYRRGVNFDPTLQWLGNDGSEFLKFQADIDYNWDIPFICVDEGDPCENFVVSGVTVIPDPTTTTTTTTTTAAPNVVVAVGGTSGQAKISRSIDGGLTWSLVHTGNASEFFLETLVFLDSNNGFAFGGSGTALKTTDGGQTWTSIAPIEPTATNTLRASANFGTTNIYVGGNGNFIYTSNDGGITWNKTPSTGGLSQLSKGMYVFDADTAISVSLIGTDKILRTTNGGLNWTNPDPSITVSFQEVDFNGGSIGIAVGNSGRAFRSTDAGLNWVDISGNLPVGAFTLQDVTFVNSTIVYVIGTTNLFKSTNAGLSWTDLSGNLPAVGSTIFGADWQDEDNGWAAVGNGNVLVTNNGGISWTTVNGAVGGDSLFDIIKVQ